MTGTGSLAEGHRGHRAAWLRAAVLGADDGVVSTASLIIGVAASTDNRAAILTAGFAGLAAGAMAMAAGEYVSVASQRDAQRADLAMERRQLAANPKAELAELTGIYVARGLDMELARTVATKLSEGDQLAVHARDELGIDSAELARPLQAAWVSAASFASCAALPILAVLAAPAAARLWVVAMTSVAALAVLGALGARVGGASKSRGAMRVIVGGSLAMTVTAIVGHFVGRAVG